MTFKLRVGLHQSFKRLIFGTLVLLLLIRSASLATEAGLTRLLICALLVPCLALLLWWDYKALVEPQQLSAYSWASQLLFGGCLALSQACNPSNEWLLTCGALQVFCLGMLTDRTHLVLSLGCAHCALLCHLNSWPLEEHLPESAVALAFAGMVIYQGKSNRMNTL